MKELIEIQKNLIAPKGQFNKFGNYHYRSCEDILAAAKPLLAENNCMLSLSDEMVQVGARIYVKATVTITNAEGQSQSCTAFAREEETKKGMDASQITGSASSYARKYALNGLFCIDDMKDADATNTNKQPTERPAATEENVAQALNEIGCCLNRQQAIAVWNKWTQQFPDFINKEHKFYIAMQQLIASLKK